jgi:hypothetical protein
MVRTLIALAAAAVPGYSVYAGREVVLDAYDRWFYQEFFHNPNNTNYGTGDANTYARSFFIFDLSGIEGTVVAAEFRMLVSNTITADPF